MPLSSSSVLVSPPATVAQPSGECHEGHSRLSEVSVYYDAGEATLDCPASPAAAPFASILKEQSTCTLRSPTILATPTSSLLARGASLRSSNSTLHHHSSSSSDIDAQVVAAGSPRERTHFDRPLLSWDLHDDECSSHSIESALADVSSNSGESSSNDHPSPLTPIYDELPGNGAISARIQGERDAALRALESRDPTKLRSSQLEGSSPGSPSFTFGSPRPTQELPSFTNSLSVAPPSVRSSHPPTSRFSSMLNPYRFPSCSDPDDSSVKELRAASDYIPSVEVTPAPSPLIIRRAGERPSLGINIPSASSNLLRSELVLDLVEPSSPDEGNFTPPADIITFASPDTAQLELTFPGFLDNEEQPSNSIAIEAFQQSRIRGAQIFSHVRQLSQETDDIRLEGADLEEPRKGSLFSKFRSIKAKVCKIFNGDSTTAKVRTRSRANSTASELVSPHTPSYLVSLQLPHGAVHGTSPTSVSYGRSADLDSLQLPAFTLTDAPDSAPPPRGTRFATVTAVPQLHRRSRRFSLQPSIFMRTRARSNEFRSTVITGAANATHLGVPNDEQAAHMRHSILSPFNIGAMLSREALQVPSVLSESAPTQENTPTLGAPFVRRPISRQPSINHDEILEVRRSTCGLEDELSAGRDLRNRLSVISTVQ